MKSFVNYKLKIVMLCSVLTAAMSANAHGRAASIGKAERS
jgi:hypothetical protein